MKSIWKFRLLGAIRNVVSSAGIGSQAKLGWVIEIGRVSCIQFWKLPENYYFQVMDNRVILIAQHLFKDDLK